MKLKFNSLWVRLGILSILPALEIALVRHWININSDFPVDSFLFSTLFAGSFFFYLSETKVPLALGFQKKIMVFHLLAFASFYILIFQLGKWETPLGSPLFSALWLTAILLALSSAFFVFLDPALIRAKIRLYPNEFFFGLLAALAPVLTSPLWRYLARPTTFSCYWLLKGLGLPMIDSGIPNHLDHPLFHATIAPVCSGVEGIYFFTFIFGIIGMLHWKDYSRKAIAISFLAGNGMMFTLNVLRITVFFGVAVWLTEKWGADSKSGELFKWAFHAHIGWILYFIGLGLFFWIMPRFRKIKPHKNGE